MSIWQLVHRRGATWAAMLVVAHLSACTPSANAPGPGTSTADKDDGLRPLVRTARGGRKDDAAWPFWPVKMRIHPLTRVLPDPASDQLVIETRIEFQDVGGQTAKAVGALTIQLHKSVAQEAVKTWNTDLHALSTNREHYDDITRTYLFRLGVSEKELTDASLLHAMFVSDDGQIFEHSWRVER